MSVKTVALATVFVFGAGLLALYAAWQLDESKKLVRTNVVEQSEEDGTLVIEMKERLGDDFIVLCPEERFQEAFDELRSFVEVSTEPLYFPGGPMALAFAEFEIPDNLAPAHRVLQDFLRRYSPGRVVLVSHSECLYYESLAIFDNSLDGVQERQLQDLASM